MLNKKSIIALTAVFLIKIGMPVCAEGQTIKRISGNNRIETSIEVSKYGNQKSEKVIIADAKNYPDALSASNLTMGSYPILLVDKKLDKKTIEEIKRLEASEVMIIGGEASIPKNVEEELNKLETVEEVERIAGKDRYDTSLKVFNLEENIDKKDKVVLTSGQNFADALSIGGLLKERSLVLASTTNISKLNTSDVLVVGGKSSLSNPRIDLYPRISGSNRYKTSVKVAESINSNTVIIASGSSFADALSASTLSQKLNSPILLVGKTYLDQSIIDYLKNYKIEDVIIVGGRGSVSLKIENDIKKLINGEDVFSKMVFKPMLINNKVKTKIYGNSYKQNNNISLNELAYIPVAYRDFNNKLSYGEIIVNKKVGKEVAQIFKELYEAGVKIEKIRLVDEYNSSDIKSMEDNNTSAFNYRVIKGTNRLSKHSLGYAIDINTLYNPHVVRGVANPRKAQAYAKRTRNNPYMIFQNDKTYNIFKKYGWKWGGHWRYPDYQHFEK